MRMFRALLLVLPFASLLLCVPSAFPQSSAQSPKADEPSPQSQSAQLSAADDKRLSLTKDVMNEMAGGQMTAVCDRFTPDLKDNLTEDKMQFVWNRLTGVAGGFQKQLSQSTRTIRGMTTYVAKSQFEDSKVELRLVFNDQNQISHIWIAPVSDLARRPWKPPRKMWSSRCVRNSSTSSPFVSATNFRCACRGPPGNVLVARALASGAIQERKARGKR